MNAFKAFLSSNNPMESSRERKNSSSLAKTPTLQPHPKLSNGDQYRAPIRTRSRQPPIGNKGLPTNRRHSIVADALNPLTNQISSALAHVGINMHKRAFSTSAAVSDNKISAPMSLVPTLSRSATAKQEIDSTSQPSRSSKSVEDSKKVVVRSSNKDEPSSSKTPAPVGSVKLAKAESRYVEAISASSSSGQNMTLQIPSEKISRSSKPRERKPKHNNTSIGPKRALEKENINSGPLAVNPATTAFVYASTPVFLRTKTKYRPKVNRTTDTSDGAGPSISRPGPLLPSRYSEESTYSVIDYKAIAKHQAEDIADLNKAKAELLEREKKWKKEKKDLEAEKEEREKDIRYLKMALEAKTLQLENMKYELAKTLGRKRAEEDKKVFARLLNTAQSRGSVGSIVDSLYSAISGENESATDGSSLNTPATPFFIEDITVRTTGSSGFTPSKSVNSVPIKIKSSTRPTSLESAFFRPRTAPARSTLPTIPSVGPGSTNEIGLTISPKDELSIKREEEHDPFV